MKGVYGRIAHSTRKVAKKIKHEIRGVVPKKKALGVAIVFAIICIVGIGVLLSVQINDVLNIDIFNLEAVDIKSDDEIARTCNVDEECVPDSCCHAFRCVNKNYAPSCAEIMCTAECKPETMDCGQGYCACTAGLCEAYILNPK